MWFRKNEKTVVFIDGANLYSTAKALAFDIDYRRVLKFFQSETSLVRINYYTVMSEDQEYSSIRPLIDWLDYNGFTIITKPTKEFADATGRRKIKGSMDIEIAVDLMNAAAHADHLILFSGDGDFRYLVDAAQRKGAKVTVISTFQSHPPMIADELRRQADQFIDLSTTMNIFSRGDSQSRAMKKDDVYDDDFDDFED